jgi:predicted transport protein
MMNYKLFSYTRLKVDKTVFQLYLEYRDAICGLSKDIREIPLHNFISFKYGDDSIVGIQIQKNSLKIILNAEFGMLKDPKKLFRNMAGINHHSQGDYQVIVDSTDDLKYVVELVMQILKTKQM